MLLPDLVRRIQACQLILLFLLPRTLTRGEMLHRPPLRGMRPRKNLSFLHLPALMQAEAQSVLQAQDQHPDEMVSTQCLPHQMGQEKQPAGCQMTVLPFLSLQPLPTLAASPGLLHPWLRNHQKLKTAPQPSMSQCGRSACPEHCQLHWHCLLLRGALAAWARSCYLARRCSSWTAAGPFSPHPGSS